mmetsp:Transcript_44275/g.117393  ORF Transcript_44275/g.117393 Transcript_44275/m.117393 type:complete len:239 (+) Transcript_44275:157-873(+)
MCLSMHSLQSSKLAPKLIHLFFGGHRRNPQIYCIDSCRWATSTSMSWNSRIAASKSSKGSFRETAACLTAAKSSWMPCRGLLALSRSSLSPRKSSRSSALRSANSLLSAATWSRIALASSSNNFTSSSVSSCVGGSCGPSGTSVFKRGASCISVLAFVSSSTGFISSWASACVGIRCTSCDASDQSSFKRVASILCILAWALSTVPMKSSVPRRFVNIALLAGELPIEDEGLEGVRPP